LARFIKAVRRVPLEVQLFCLVLSLSGGRISEILSLTPAAIDLESHTYEAPRVYLFG
jgi:integrase